MQQNKTLFFGIIGLAVIIVIMVFAARMLFSSQLDLPLGQTKVSVRLIAAPSIKPWLDQSVQAFNQRDANTQVEIVAADSLIPTAQIQTDIPAAWLAEATFVVAMANENNLSFNNPRPIASTTLAWGTFKDKQDEFTQKYGGLTWEGLHTKAVSPEDRLTLVIASPNNSAEGLAALISATAAYLKKDTLNSAEINQAEAWLSETLGGNSRILPKPAEAFATQGRSVGDTGVLSQATWRSVSALQSKTDFALTPTLPRVVLDYPLTIRANASPAEQTAIKAFGDFLLEEGQQNTLANFALDRAVTTSDGVKVDGTAALALKQWAERILK